MITSLLQLLLKNIPADYSWDDEGVVRLGSSKDIAAYTAGDFKGPCLIFCHGNGETAVSERYWFKKLVGAGVSIVCPDYRGYGLTEGRLSEAGCYEVAHAAYSYLVDDRRVNPNDVYVLGYSLGSAIAVELASSEQVCGLILQAPFVSGEELLKVWAKTYAEQIPDCVLKAGLKAISAVFPTSSRLPKIAVTSLVVHGTSDDVIPYSQGEQVFALLSSPQKRFVPVKNGGHNTFQYLMGDDYIRTLVEFMGLAMPASRPQAEYEKPSPESDSRGDYDYCALFEESENRMVLQKEFEMNRILKVLLIVSVAIVSVITVLMMYNLSSAEGVEDYRRRAETGDPAAQYNLGVCYMKGDGVEKDEAEAYKWFRLSAIKGYADAEFCVALCLAAGQGVKQNGEEAAEWLRRAAGRGHKMAKEQLLVMEKNQPSKPKARTLNIAETIKAADGGDAQAQYDIGFLYSKGIEGGIEKDEVKAAKYYRMAAEQGFMLAQHNLGCGYATGRGVERNYAEAQKWFVKAAEQGDPSAQFNAGTFFYREIGGGGLRKTSAKVSNGFLSISNRFRDRVLICQARIPVRLFVPWRNSWPVRR